MWKIFAIYVSIVCISVAVVKSQTNQDAIEQDRPCDHPNAISLPSDHKCLIPIKTLSTWGEASRTCESLGGSLYETPDARLASRPELLKCLTAMSDVVYTDMWINAVGLWSPHFFWINGTLLNKIDYCSRLQPRPDSGYGAIASDTLSVDYCVSTCHDNGNIYVILHKSGKFPECYCRKDLPRTYQSKCYTETVDYDSPGSYFIVHSKEDSLIKISSGDAFTKTEILCATVDTKTLSERQMKSGTCFTENQFICCLGEAHRCVDENCFGTECRFLMKDKCMLRVSLSYTWYAARAYCVNRGGDLWNMHELNEMTQVNQYLVDETAYWIGATNYGWTFNGTSNDGLAFNDNIRVRCGHMFRERDTSSNSWKWSDTECTQQKAFLCQFNKSKFTEAELEKEVMCPWPLGPSTTTTTLPNTWPMGPSTTTTTLPNTWPMGPSTTTTTLPNTTDVTVTFGNSTAGNFTAIITEQLVGIFDEESFPIAAVIAAIIASIVLLTCLGFAFTWCARSNGRFRRVRERLAFIPYFADIPVAEYEGHGAMSSVPDHGSQVGLVKNEYQNHMSGYAMSSSYAEQSGMFAGKSMERGQQESMNRRLSGSQNYLANGHSSAEERGFAAANSSMSSIARDYMTLQAQMNILDDAEIAALRESFRRKPEVSVVTDNVDLNFTVNHAVSQGQSQVAGELARASVERTMEGIIMPATEGGLTLSLPDRVIEEGRIYSTMKTTYNV